MKVSVRETERLAGQAIIAGFEGTTLPSSLEKRLAEGGLGGIILFKRNVTTPDELSALLSHCRRISPRPVLLGVDQEGGRVVRLKAPFTVLPPARRLGDRDDVDITLDAGHLVGEELSSVGFNLNFAPVLDVDTNPDSPVIGDRAFADSVDGVWRHAAPFAAGLIQGGIIPCAKHFPGHGDAALDSHLALPQVTLDDTRLTEVESAPFRCWVTARMGPVMSAHVIYSAWDPERPATLSRRIITGKLRENLDHDGVVFSDDLEMGALDAFGDTGAVASRALAAGVDALLICRSEEKQAAAIHAVTERAVVDARFLGRLREAVSRIYALAVAPRRETPFQWLGSSAHLARQQALLARIDELNEA